MTPHLIINHLAGDRFQVLHGDGAPASAEVQLPDPTLVRVFEWEDKESSLPDGLRWYFETYATRRASAIAEAAFEERAADVLLKLDQWGQKAFELLFQDRHARAGLERAESDGPGWHLRLQSDDGHVLSWPWEALRDPLRPDVMGLNAAMDRRVSVERPSPLPTGLPTDRMRVLLVTARPLTNDVDYRLVSGPLLDQVLARQLPIEIVSLRPPTYEALQTEMESSPMPYHVLHFDGHGAHRDGKGKLYFEFPDGHMEVEARQVAQWLTHHPVPIVVLNACRSGTLERGSAPPFSALATELLRGGVRSVVAMTEVLHRDGARAFVPAFYRELVQSGSVSQAVMCGRLSMQQNARRARPRGGGTLSLRDDILPVVYQNEPLQLDFTGGGQGWRRIRQLPAEAQAHERLYDRDSQILELERAIRAKQPLVLVHGPVSAGKSELVRDFATWLEDTAWKGRIDWISLAAVGSADAVLNRMGMVFGQPFFARSAEERIELLGRGPDGREVLTIWDGLEVVDDWEQGATDLLRQLVLRFRRANHRIIATARAVPSWMQDLRPVAVAVSPPTGDWYNVKP